MITRRHFLPLIAAPLVAGPAPIQGSGKLPVTTMILGGDVMLSRNVAVRARRQNDPAWPFRRIAPVFRQADIAFVNLEAPFSDQGAKVEKGMIFKDEPEMVAGLELAGIDIVSTANNHARDRGVHGIEFTLDHLAAHGIATVGTGKTSEDARRGTVLTRNGVRFGFLAYTYDANNGNYTDIEPRVNLLNIDRMREDVAAMKPRAEAIIVSMHAGTEYALKPNAQQTAFARAAAEAGAAVVVGHHPHVRQPWGYYGGTPIFYSLGNLIFDQFQRKETQIGLIAELEFRGAQLSRARTRTVKLVLTAPQLEDETTDGVAGAPAREGR